MEGILKRCSNGEKTMLKKVVYTPKDIQDNCMRIKVAMEQTPVGTSEYDKLQKELEQWQVILKRYKDARFYIAPKDALVIGGTTIGTLFFIALTREFPSALKTASLLLKIIPYKGL